MAAIWCSKRLDDAQAKLLLDAEAAFAKRFKDQTPAPGGEAAVRKMIEGIRTGRPDYGSMSAGLAEATRQQLPDMQAEISKLGAIQSMTFKGVGPGGADIYLFGFEKGGLEYRIGLGVNGKVEGANFRPATIPATAASLRPLLPQMDSLSAADLTRRPVGSVTVGVIAGKELIWSKSYGDADAEKKIPADADTVYRIGSIRKMFTALMLEQLVDAGKVHLSDPVENTLLLRRG